MDIARSFTYVFDDERWIGKLIVGAAIAMFSIFILPAFLLSGYTVAIIRRVIAEDTTPLPEWDDWGQLFKDGVALFLIQLVYGAPIWLLLGCGLAGTAVLTGGFNNADEALAGGLAGIWVLVSCAAFLLGILLALITPVAYIRYAVSGDIGHALRIQEVLGEVRDNLGQIVLLTVALLGVALVISAGISVIGIIPCIGWLVALVGSLAIAPYLTFVSGHLYGQLAQVMGAAPPAKAEDEV